jgi:hypothetical protein
MTLLKNTKTEQPNLFETPKSEGYPILMKGRWIGKYEAYALVDTPEHEKELLDQGYEHLE